MILDIHTHHAFPQPLGVINLRVNPDTDIDEVKEEILRDPHQLYSIGMHPWDVASGEDYDDVILGRLREVAALEGVVAIGESGVDPNGNAPFFRQMLLLKKIIEISEELAKPLILHAVKSDDIICGLRRDLQPHMCWMVHGYRGKPQGAAQLVKSGCMLGFGEKFNVETLRSMPLDMILAETDESVLDIQEVIERLSEERGVDLQPVVAENSAKFLKFGSKN